MTYKSTGRADIGDYLKVFACTAVMGQPIISLMIQHQPLPIQTNLGSIYNLIKYTAPAFIFGILYTDIRQHSILGYLDSRAYYRNIFQSLFIPTIIWTTIYLIGMPNLQQCHPYHSCGGFLWQFINGNAAPHLWYNSMMLQFAVLVPLFWQLHLWLSHGGRKRAIITLVTTAVFYFAWLAFYDHYVFHGPEEHHWYLLDRIFLSFLIYAIFGVMAWNYRRHFNHMVIRFWPIFLVVLAAMFVKTNHELRSFGWPINLYNATYYKPSMTIYSLMVICLVATLAVHDHLRHHRHIQSMFHELADLAYRAYLGNVFFEQVIWHLINGQQYSQNHPYLCLIMVWISTWLVSFLCAYLVKVLVSHYQLQRR